jgi:hypothetical protein
VRYAFANSTLEACVPDWIAGVIIWSDLRYGYAGKAIAEWPRPCYPHSSLKAPLAQHIAVSPRAYRNG